MASITFKHVRKTYPGGVTVVPDLNLEIQHKEFVILVGPSGCGKSTTLRMIAGLEDISDGELLIGDRVVNDVAPKDRDIAMVFQNYALYPHMTVLENICFPLEIQRVKKAERVERIAAEGGNWPLADQEFHWAIIKASHNEYMRRLYPIINSAVDEILQISPSRQRMQDIALGDNRTILAFLLKRDEEGARCAMSIHMKHLINTLQD